MVDQFTGKYRFDVKVVDRLREEDDVMTMIVITVLVTCPFFLEGSF
jgi:hypothetical protein